MRAELPLVRKRLNKVSNFLFLLFYDIKIGEKKRKAKKERFRSIWHETPWRRRMERFTFFNAQVAFVSATNSCPATKQKLQRWWFRVNDIIRLNIYLRRFFNLSFTLFCVFFFARAGETCKILWMINITHTALKSHKLIAVYQALRWNQSDGARTSSLKVHQLKFTGNARQKTINFIVEPRSTLSRNVFGKHELCVEGQQRGIIIRCLSWMSEGAINCKISFYSTRGFFDINNSSS